MSCKNAQEFLGRQKIEPQEVVDARLVRIDADQAWSLLKDAASVTVAKGKNFRKFTNVAAQKEEILGQAMGPSGNLRAPTFRAGRDFVIGFSPELYEDWVK